MIQKKSIYSELLKSIRSMHEYKHGVAREAPPSFIPLLSLFLAFLEGFPFS